MRFLYLDFFEVKKPKFLSLFDIESKIKTFFGRYSMRQSSGCSLQFSGHLQSIEKNTVRGMQTLVSNRGQQCNDVFILSLFT